MARKRKQIVKKHILIPQHTKLSVKDRDELFKKYHISEGELPNIRKDDPAIALLGVKEGDIIKITRNSVTGGEIEFFRVVVSE